MKLCAECREKLAEAGMAVRIDNNNETDGKCDHCRKVKARKECSIGKG